MTNTVRIIVIILCSLVGCLYCLDDSNRRAFFGENCQRDHDCITNAYCRAQLNCQCEPYHSPSLDQSMCIPTIGLYCTNHTTCAPILNGECRQGLCICKDDFVLDALNSSICIGRPANIGDRCQTQAACKDSLGHAYCVNEQCECLTGYHYSNETGSCVQNRGLFSDCTYDYECYLDDKSTDVMECKKQMCVCKEGERCYSKGSLITAAGTLMMASLLLQQRIA